MRFHELNNIEFKPHKPKVSEQPTLEKFDTLNALSFITNQDDHVIPHEFEQALKHFIDTCIDYKVDSKSTNFINQLLQSNDGKTEASVTLHSVTGLKQHVINTLIRQQLICKMNELAKEQERNGESLDKKLNV